MAVVEQNKIALGTAQFGFPYGISNERGQVPQGEVCDILNFCQNQFIDVIDTAAAYGNSEEIIGNCLASNQLAFKIITKLPVASKPEEVKQYIQSSLQKLQVSKLYGYLFHDFASFQRDPVMLEEVLKYQQNGIIQNVGFSVYYPHQLEYLLQNNLPFGLVQLPFNVLDQRFAYLFPELKKNDVEIHVRSVFLQGLLLTNPEPVNNFFEPLVPRLKVLHQLAHDLAITLPHLLLGFAHLQNNIDKIVVGVTSLSDLEMNLGYLPHLNTSASILDELKALAITDEQLILPFNWKTK